MACRTRHTYSYQVSHGHHRWAVGEGATEIPNGLTEHRCCSAAAAEPASLEGNACAFASECTLDFMTVGVLI